MGDFGYIARIISDATEAGAWPNLAIFFGGAFVIGLVVGKVAFLLSRVVGIIASACAIYYIYGLIAESGGIVYPVAYPPAWVAWGVLLIAWRRGYAHLRGRGML